MNNKDIHEMYCAMFNEGIIPIWFDTLENRASFFELAHMGIDAKLEFYNYYINRKMDVYENIQNNQYTNKLPYPSKPTTKEIDEAMGTFKGTIHQIREEREATEIRLKNEYKLAVNHYRNEDNRLFLQFKQDLAEDFGVTDNPKVDKLFTLAWEHGHSTGYLDVYNYYSEFVELLN